MAHAEDSRPVLVVDDDESMRFIISFSLDQAGIPNIVATSGEEALDLLAITPVAAVLLDKQLPRMSGIEVLEAIRSRPETATLPVVMVTADDTVDDRVGGLGAGADDYLVKPFAMPELVARIKAHLRGQAAWAEVISEHLRERAAIAKTLEEASAGHSAEATASAFCRELCRLSDVSGAALVAFTAPNVAVALAVAGQPPAGLPGPGALSAGLAKDLTARAVSGPWLAERPEPGVLACAPLVRSSQPIGVLLIQAGASASTAGAGRALAAAIDYAAIATGLLGLALTGPVASDASRAEMERIIELEAFGPVFQPIVSLAGGDIVGYEALTRFDDGSRPDVRFAEARALGLGLELERATLEASLAAAESLPEGRWVSINVSPDLVQLDEVLNQALARSGRKLVLELTEHDPVEDYQRLRAAIDGLGSELQLSVDDAGSGFSSLRHVLALEPAYMKLDQSWISGVQADPARQALIAGLVHFARQTGCQLIAEGIETTPELGVLTGLSVDLGQGFLLGRPAAA